VTQDETFTGGLCLVAIEPVSNYILLEQVAEARDHDTWSEAMAGALAPLKCHVIQSTSDEAPGLLAYVEHHLGAQHSPVRRGVSPWVLTSAIGENKKRHGNANTQKDPFDICGCGDVLHERIQPRRFHSFMEERIFTRLRHSEKPHSAQCLGVCRRLQFVSMCQRRRQETEGIHSAPCKTPVHACIRGL